jgi:hypothetical protein
MIHAEIIFSFVAVSETKAEKLKSDYIFRPAGSKLSILFLPVIYIYIYIYIYMEKLEKYNNELGLCI